MRWKRRQRSIRSRFTQDNEDPAAKKAQRVEPPENFLVRGGDKKKEAIEHEIRRILAEILERFDLETRALCPALHRGVGVGFICGGKNVEFCSSLSLRH